MFAIYLISTAATNSAQEEASTQLSLAELAAQFFGFMVHLDVGQCRLGHEYCIASQESHALGEGGEEEGRAEGDRVALGSFPFALTTKFKTKMSS